MFDGEWNWGTWFLAHASGEAGYEFGLPDVDGEYCTVTNYYDWNSDSRRFAIYHGGQHYTFLWHVNESRGPSLIRSTRTVNCRDNRDWEKGRYVGSWE